MWRSLVAHLHGVQGVEGSNPFTPTILRSLVTKVAGLFALGQAKQLPLQCRPQVFTGWTVLLSRSYESLDINRMDAKFIV